MTVNVFFLLWVRHLLCFCSLHAAWEFEFEKHALEVTHTTELVFGRKSLGEGL
jgi:hypothetical protein